MNYDFIPITLYSLGVMMLGALALVQWKDERVTAAATHTP